MTVRLPHFFSVPQPPEPLPTPTTPNDRLRGAHSIDQRIAGNSAKVRMSTTTAHPTHGASSTSHAPFSVNPHHAPPTAPAFPSWYPPIDANVPSHPCRLYFLPLPSSTPPVRPMSTTTMRASLSQSVPVEWSPPVPEIGRVMALIETACNNGFSCHHILRQESHTHTHTHLPSLLGCRCTAPNTPHLLSVGVVWCRAASICRRW